MKRSTPKASVMDCLDESRPKKASGVTWRPCSNNNTWLIDAEPAGPCGKLKENVMELLIYLLVSPVVLAPLAVFSGWVGMELGSAPTLGRKKGGVA